MRTEISWAAIGDAKELESLDRMAHEEDRFWKMQSKSKFEGIIKKSKFLTLIAREDGRAIAYLQSGERNTRTHVWVENVFVAEKFRGRNIAKSLMEKFTNHWRGRVDYIVLLTADEKVDIFKRLGFEKEMNYMAYKHSRKNQG
jgi:ribosomal protein S18 acetylase RimI-like enzyme